eukprot:8672127-Pyramimonas_sp.AAC.1
MSTQPLGSKWATGTYVGIYGIWAPSSRHLALYPFRQEAAFGFNYIIESDQTLHNAQTPPVMDVWRTKFFAQQQRKTRDVSRVGRLGLQFRPVSFRLDALERQLSVYFVLCL